MLALLVAFGNMTVERRAKKAAEAKARAEADAKKQGDKA
jgi:hypothetical protein